jgi:hypothetical protein
MLPIAAYYAWIAIQQLIKGKQGDGSQKDVRSRGTVLLLPELFINNSQLILLLEGIR